LVFPQGENFLLGICESEVGYKSNFAILLFVQIGFTFEFVSSIFSDKILLNSFFLFLDFHPFLLTVNLLEFFGKEARFEDIFLLVLVFPATLLVSYFILHELGTTDFTTFVL